MAVSKKLKQLKEYKKANDSFSQIKQKLVKEGICNRQGLEGRITFFNAARGYGFIKAGGDTYFIHVKAIEGNQYPANGDKFSFTLGGDGRVNRAFKIDSKDTQSDSKGVNRLMKGMMNRCSLWLL